MFTAEPVSRAAMSAVVIHWSPMVRLGIRSAAETAKCFYVVGDTADADEGMRLVESSRPDIVVMDMQFPTYTGFDLLRDLGNRWPLVRVLIYSGVTVRDFPERCLRKAKPRQRKKPCNTRRPWPRKARTRRFDGEPQSLQRA